MFRIRGEWPPWGGERKKAGIAKNVSVALADVAKVMVSQGKEIWLGGLDSNQDSQIQNLESCQLDDLPAVVRRDGLGQTGFRVCAYKP